MVHVSLAVYLNVNTLRVLLIKEKGENEWKFPGGKIEENENSKNSAAREVGEELGQAFGSRIQKTHDFMNFVSPTKNHPEGVSFSVKFIEIHPEEGSAVLLEKGIKYACYFSIYDKKIMLTSAGRKIFGKLRRLYKYTLAA
jgi:8-oxo-dGTP pyrophosphatase MutT (NUDIX family)